MRPKHIPVPTPPKPTPKENMTNRIAFVITSVLMFVLPLFTYYTARDRFNASTTNCVISVVAAVFSVKFLFLIYVFCFDKLNFPKDQKAEPGKKKQKTE